MNIKIKKLTSTAKLPTKKDCDVGYDLYADSIETDGDAVIIHTGIAIEMEKCFWALIADRSSMGKKGFNVHGGIIDNSYRGEIIVILYKHKEFDINKVINVGDKIAQLIIMQQFSFDVLEVSELSVTERNEKGFGSTGK
jgi:dUTP pyrophosphatase